MEDSSAEFIPLTANQYRVDAGHGPHKVTVLVDGRIQVDDRVYTFSLISGNRGSYSLLLDELVFEISINEIGRSSDDKPLQIQVNRASFDVIVEDHHSYLKRKSIRGKHGSSEIQVVKSPMPGKVVRVEVAVGEQVSEGQGLIVLEAMKMENEIKSSMSGTVEMITVDSGKTVEKGEILLSITPKE